MEDLLRRAASGEGAYHKKTSKVYNPSQGVSEMRSEEEDSIRGMETVQLCREMGDQRVSVTKQRNMRTEEENTIRDLRHVRSDEVQDFDRRWAERSSALTGYNSQTLPPSSRTQPAIEPPMSQRSQQREVRREVEQPPQYAAHPSSYSSTSHAEARASSSSGPYGSNSHASARAESRGRY